jgi:hypothetical protein
MIPQSWLDLKVFCDVIDNLISELLRLPAQLASVIDLVLLFVKVIPIHHCK